ncbi:MAG TPA: hypothetical protein VFC46_11240 [Humisphaera sp.]|nr:hypothetical protein [Humisphaera sp.]
MEQPCGGMVAVELPTLRETTVRSQGSCDSGDMATIHMLSGPDDHGRIAYIEDHFFVKNEKNRRHLLKLWPWRKDAQKLSGNQWGWLPLYTLQMVCNADPRRKIMREMEIRL